MFNLYANCKNCGMRILIEVVKDKHLDAEAALLNAYKQEITNHRTDADST